MNEDWIESKLQQSSVPPSGGTRERTVALARAIAPAKPVRLRSRIAKPRVVVPLAVLMIAVLSAPGQAATRQVGNVVANIVPGNALQATTVVGQAGGTGKILRARQAPPGAPPGGQVGAVAQAVGPGLGGPACAVPGRARGRSANVARAIEVVPRHIPPLKPLHGRGRALEVVPGRSR